MISIQIGAKNCIKIIDNPMNPVPNMYSGNEPKNTFPPSNPEIGNIENIAKVYAIFTISLNPGNCTKIKDNNNIVNGPTKCILASSCSDICLYFFPILFLSIDVISELPIAANFRKPFEINEKNKGNMIPAISGFLNFAFFVNHHLCNDHILNVEWAWYFFAISLWDV